MRSAGTELQPCLPLVQFWTGNAAAGRSNVRELRAICKGAELKTQFITIPWSLAALHTEIIGIRYSLHTALSRPVFCRAPCRASCEDRYGAACCFPLGDALPMGAFAACSLLRIEHPDAAKLPCSAASLLCPFRVARVSRLIGKSDTTVNRGRLASRNLWQATSALNMRCTQSTQTHRNATPNGVAFLLSCAGHWPPKSYGGRWFFPPYLLQAVPAGHSLFKGPLLFADALAGCLLFFGLAGLSPAAGTSLALKL